MFIELLVEFRDLWLGIFWDRRRDGFLVVYHIYIGIPFLVLHVGWVGGVYKDEPLPKPFRLFRIGRDDI